VYSNKKATTFSVKARNVITNIEPSMNYHDMRKETLALLNKIYEFNEEGRLLQTSIFSSIEFIKGQGIINFSFTALSIPYLLTLGKDYSLVTIRDLISFSSMYATKMYLIVLNQNRGEAFKISIKDLKTHFNIQNQYKDYNTFKNRVILKAQKELHFTSLAFTFKEVKIGRKVEFFIFKTLEVNQILLSTTQTILAKKLTQDLEVTPNQAKKILIEFLPEEIHQIVFSIKERYRRGQIKSSLGAYTVSVFSGLSKQSLE